MLEARERRHTITIHHPTLFWANRKFLSTEKWLSRNLAKVWNLRKVAFA
jgi:hypothetical protein